MIGDVDALAREVVEGSPRSLARALTWVESGGDRAETLVARLYVHTGRAHVVGVTGAPGSGKSTLVRVLARVARARGRTVGILAVDPSSPFSGGAILGDRIRMNDLTLDPGVFIRSMATAGALEAHLASMKTSGELDRRRRRMVAARVLRTAQDLVAARLLRPEALEAPGGETTLLDRVMRRELAPHACARALLTRMGERTPDV